VPLILKVTKSDGKSIAYYNFTTTIDIKRTARKQ
jgi:hypothetical protein